MVWLPTGFGKFLCYTALLLAFDYKLCCIGSDFVSLVVVDSPLISLMTDQVMNLRAKGVSSAIMTCSSCVQKDLMGSNSDLSRCSLLFCAAEALVGSRWREAYEMPGLSERIVAIVIDKVHSISMW